MRYSVVKANGKYLDGIYYEKVVNAYIKDQTVAEVNGHKITILGSTTKDGITTIKVST